MNVIRYVFLPSLTSLRFASDLNVLRRLEMTTEQCNIYLNLSSTPRNVHFCGLPLDAYPSASEHQSVARTMDGVTMDRLSYLQQYHLLPDVHLLFLSRDRSYVWSLMPLL